MVEGFSSVFLVILNSLLADILLVALFELVLYEIMSLVVVVFSFGFSSIPLYVAKTGLTFWFFGKIDVSRGRQTCRRTTPTREPARRTL